MGYYPIECKRACSILLKKGGKWDFRLVKSYKVINWLNCIDKVVEKVVIKELSHYYKKYFKLDP